MNTLNKAAHLRQLTFSLLVVLVFTLTGCEDPGSTGSQFVSKSELVIDTVLVDDLTERTMDPFLGRLQRAAAGQFTDDIFGTIRAVSYFKPDISSVADTLQATSSSELVLRLRSYANNVYGDTTGSMQYDIYRVTDQWRGTTVRKSSTINYNQAELIGQFSDTDADTNGTISVVLGGSFRDDYITYLNADAQEVEQQYLQQEYGLAIVPSGGTSQRINYLNFIGTDLFIQIDSERGFPVPILDWAFDFEQTNPAYAAERLYPSNVDKYYQLSFASLVERIRDQNVIRAEFVLYEDTLALKNTLEESEVRSDGFEMAMIVGPEPDPDFSIGFQTVDLNGFKLTNGNYVFNMTTALNNSLFADTDLSEIYLFLNTEQGLISFSNLFYNQSDPALQPKVLLYTLRTDE